jgi:hypothetical protein
MTNDIKDLMKVFSIWNESELFQHSLNFGVNNRKRKTEEFDDESMNNLKFNLDIFVDNYTDVWREI